MKAGQQTQNRRKTSQRKNSITGQNRSKSRQRSQSVSKNKTQSGMPKIPSHQQDQRSGKKFRIKINENQNQSQLIGGKQSQAQKRRSGRESLDLTYCQANKRKIDQKQNNADSSKKQRCLSPLDNEQDAQRSRSRCSSNRFKKPVENFLLAFSNTETHSCIIHNINSLDGTNQLGHSEDESDIQSYHYRDMLKDQNSRKNKPSVNQSHYISEAKYGSSSKNKRFEKDQDISSSYNIAELDDMQRQLMKAKGKIYDYQYKIDSLKKRLCEAEKQTSEWKDKFNAEQEKSDEFFSKAEKYKIIAKDYRKEIEKLKVQIEQSQREYKQDNKNYETLLKLREENEMRVNNQREFLEQELISGIKHLQKISQGIDKHYLLVQPINNLLEIISSLNEDGKSPIQTRINTDQSIYQSQHYNNQTHFIGDSQDSYKVTQDAIIYNGESLNQEEQSYQKNMAYQDNDKIYKLSHQDQQSKQQSSYTPLRKFDPSQQVSSDTQSYYSNHNFNQNNLANNQEELSHSYSQSLGSQGVSQNQLHQNQDQSQYDILLKIQQEMQQIKQESQKVIQDNQILNEKNQKLLIELDQERANRIMDNQYREQQFLLPQYKEALDQLRKANELMQKKIESLEQERSQSNQANKIEDEMKDMQMKIQQYDYENQNLRAERDHFVQQIQKLETQKKNSEKITNFFASQGNNQVPQQQIQQQMKIQEAQEVQRSIIQPAKFLTSNSLSNTHSGNNTRSQFNQQIINFQQQLEDQCSSNQSKSPNNSYYSDPYANQIQAFTLNQLTQSDFNLTQSFLSKQNLGKNVQIQQFQPSGTESSLYVDTGTQDKIDLNNIQINEGENIFSLSSTYPENQMRLSSPLKQNPAPRKIDQINLQEQSLIQQNVSQVNKDVNILDQKPQNLNLLNAGWQISRGYLLDQLQVHEILQTQSQEVTNRDKNAIQMIVRSQGTNSQNQIPFSEQNMSHFDQESNQNPSGGSLRNKIIINEDIIGSSNQSSNIVSERSLDQNLQVNVLQKNQNYTNKQHQSQETFYVKNANGSIQSQFANNKDLVFSKSNTNTTSQRSKNQSQNQNQINNKENIVLMEEDLIFQNASQNQSIKIKSPAFYESNNNQSDSENFNFEIQPNQFNYHNQSTFDQYLQNGKNDSYCTTDKQNTLASGLVINNNTSCMLEGASQSQNGGNFNSTSVQSNFMSERTKNIKKEIYTLDEEILQLQNSLKNALQKKAGEIIN